MRRYIGFYYIVGILFLLLPACVQEELQQVLGKGEGILRLGVTSVASGLSSPQTKATVSLPSEITIEIIGEEGTKTETIAVDGSSMNKDIALKTGTYTVRAYAGTHNLAQNDPYFESESKSVTIRSLQSTNVELEATVKNAWIVPNVEEDLKKHYTNWAVNLVVDGNSFPLTSKEAESTNGLFVQAGKSVDLTFDGVNVLGETKKTPLTTIQTEAAKKYLITCNPDVPQFSMELTANATHTKDGSGNLNGTDVTFVVNSFTGSNSLVQSWKVEVSYNGAVIRKYESSSVPVVGNSYTMNVVDGWPYVPQGSTLSASLTLKTGEVITPTISFNLPKPTFGVTLSAYTSYDKYAGTNGITKNVTEANNCNAETLYNAGAAWSISTDLMANKNYAKTLKIYIDGDASARTFEVRDEYGDNSYYENIGNLSWAAHSLKASVTFDGVTVESAEQTHHITGLPYNAAPPRNTGAHPWRIVQNGTGNYIEFNDSYVLLKGDAADRTRDPVIGSSAFHVPSIIKFRIDSKFKKNSGTLDNYKYRISLLSGNTIDGSNICEISVKNKGEYSVTGISNFTDSQNAIACRWETKTILGSTANLIYVYINYSE